MTAKTRPLQLHSIPHLLAVQNDHHNHHDYYNHYDYYYNRASALRNKNGR